MRIQSEAGVQRYGLLSFSYPSATGTFEIGYVRVLKPDGSVVETPPDNIQDMAAQITRQAPFYSDLHEKHVAVKGLSVGDVVEFRTVEHTTKSLAPGQFWTNYHFTVEMIVLDEQLEISVPSGRAVKVKSPVIQPAISEANGYRVYTWHHKNLLHKSDANDKQEAVEQLWQQVRGRLPQPDVLMTSFASWEDVGRWYGGLQDERVKPTPEITAKALELTKNASSEEAKVRAVYGYVSTQFHYIGISFGIGRYQPHSAAEVLANQYGDCKDKHTLLASLLTAVGIPAYPALISTSREIDEDVPSPGQFDHVITAVPMNGGLVWLDTTTEVGPYQYLLSPLLDKHALVIWKDKAATLTNTPRELPYGMTQVFDMDANLNDAGTLEGRAEFSARGDIEYVLRSGFRAVPLQQWKELGQRISASFGFGGEVTDVTASSPEKTDEPFHFSYKYTRKEFGDWANHRIVVPAPFIALLSPADEDTLPLGPSWLGALIDVQLRGRVELPSGYRPEVPAAIHVKKDFAEYDATYEFKDGKFVSDRHLKTLLHEVPAAERAEYKQFMKTVADDYGAFVRLSSGSKAPIASDKGDNTGSSSLNALRNLPDSSSQEAARLENEAREEIFRHDSQAAVTSLYRAVSEDPQFTRAWVMLGTILLSQKQKDAGMDAFHKAIASDPHQPAIPKALGVGLMSDSQFEEAIGVWQDFVKAHPDDADGPANLANCLIKLKRYPEAESALEAAMKVGGNRANLQAGMAFAYLQAGEREKAGAAFSKLEEVDPQGSTFNDVAYEMANENFKLPLALDYARKAVGRLESESQKITLTDLKEEDLKKIQTLSAYWDTLGWVYERMTNLDVAEQYLRASWNLTQDGVVAGHLCHLYSRVHKITQAVEMCRLAVYRMQVTGGLPPYQVQTEMNAARENLDHLTGGAKSKSTYDASDAVIRQRTFKLARFLPGTESAEFFVLMAPDAKTGKFTAAEVKFISGSDKMKLQGKQLKAIDFNFPAPGHSAGRFVRRGILGCYQYTGCSFLLLDPASVHSLR